MADRSASELFSATARPRKEPQERQSFSASELLAAPKKDQASRQDMSFSDRLLEAAKPEVPTQAFLRSMQQMPFNIASTLTGGRVGQQTAQEIENELKKLRRQSPVGSFLGEAASYVAPGAGIAKGVERFGRAARAIPQVSRVMPRGMAGRVGEAATIGVASSPLGYARPEDRGTVTAVSGIVGGALPIASRVAEPLVKGLIGAPSATKEAAARTAERLGFKITPGQVRQDVPVATAGSPFTRRENQIIANELASETTGRRAREINPQFINQRFTELGREFDRVYRGNTFIIDNQALNSLRSIANLENALPGNAQVSAVRGTAEELLNAYNRMQQTARQTGGVPMGNFGVQGELLQRLRSDLLGISRSLGPNSQVDRRQVLDLVNVIDDSVARNNPQAAAVLDVIRPQYRNTILLHELDRRGGLQGGNINLERLGDMLQTQQFTTRRAPTTGLEQLGYLGRELGIRSRGQPTAMRFQEGAEVMPGIVQKGLRGAATVAGTESQMARALQRRLAPRMIRGRPLEAMSPEDVNVLAGALGIM
jgi:hypothetical protein